MSSMTLPPSLFFSLPGTPTARGALVPTRPAVRVVRAHTGAALHGPACAAQRMVISGRMAEVCAELERMTSGATAYR